MGNDLEVTIDGRGDFNRAVWDTPDIRELVKKLALTGTNAATITKAVNSQLQSEGRLKKGEYINKSAVLNAYEHEITWTAPLADAHVKASLLKAAVGGDVTAQASYAKYYVPDINKDNNGKKAGKKAVAGRPVVALPERKKSGAKWEKGLKVIRINSDK